MTTSHALHNLGISWGSASVGAPFRSLSNQSTGGGACWSCGATGAFLSCGSCGSVQPVDPAVDYFQIFGLKREYNITDNNLEGKYKDWQKKLHPDLVHSKSEKERGYAAEQSALVIDAYRTLSKPLSRALYLLKLEGIHVDEEKTINDPELLMEMMDIREAVSDASDSQTLEKIQSQVKAKLETWSDSFQEAFDRKDFDRAVEATQRMRQSGYDDDGRRARLLLGGDSALRVVAADSLDRPGDSSSSRFPCRLLLEAQGAGTAEAAIDIKLPRRSLLVQFTCNACGERTKRLINRVAYERGTVFLQCAGCQVYHKFVDNLGLVVEYDLREENELQGENAVDTSSED
ncbi:Iron-sulfur cluster co-chaperone protein HscB, mitochondrial [Zea mays]|uniref:Iron-sulfur cluster co-chaperone protein HscB, mitochondrial n=1 Tax=Zea mays TaxID=4577 RepID=A0A3L6FHC1_MAIZE|nr:Iron-sulfur cluster co-chaperone protein HscB, mitochondrial [Zea mays]